ncbi:MAG: class I SAM-dependent methyltransferase [Acidobacteriota bacterium]|nr:class I SAM-dependent methyltransferase [Acidobacteriota bacterium]
MSASVGIIHRAVRSLTYRLGKVYPDYVGDKYLCPLCGAKLAYFLPLSMYYMREMYENQAIHSVFHAETLNLENYECPACRCSDRDRLYFLYIQKVLQNIDKSKLRILEIAPAAQLRKALRQNEQIEYRCADLFMEDVDDKVNITDMKVYQDESFDAFICSHVLEHVDDDLKAMRELYRILKHGGWGIAMVPINLALDETYENASITSESERWKHFGQNDHVRMYSKKGFVQRLNEAGFKVEQLGVDFFGREEFEKHGIHPRSVLYVVKK